MANYMSYNPMHFLPMRDFDAILASPEETARALATVMDDLENRRK